MTTAVSDPNRLTKEQLKRELDQIGIALPPSSAKKNVYVELYRRHLLEPVSDRHEFSSEDEEVSTYLKVEKKKFLKKSSTKHKSEEMDVQSLSDDELREQLELHNVECGPILETTRRVYERKLLSVLSGEDTKEQEPAMDEVDYSDEEDEEPVVSGTKYKETITRQARYPEPLRQSMYTERMDDVRQRAVHESSRTYPSDKLSRDDIHFSDYSRASRYTSSSLSSARLGATSTLAQTRKDVQPQPRQLDHPSAGKQKKKGLSIWIQLIIVIVIALIIFMVFQNMEPANKLPTHGISDSP